MALIVMRKQLLILGLLIVAASAAKGQAYACPAAWPRDRECFIRQTIYFKTGSSLLGKETELKINEVAGFLKAHPYAALTIEGHCDERGSQEHNHWLGDRRARAAAKRLVRAGVAADRIETISYGKDRPIQADHSAKARRENRRVEFVLLTPPES